MGQAAAGQAGTGDSRMIEEDVLARLVAAAQQGDPESLERLLARLRPMVLRRCSR